MNRFLILILFLLAYLGCGDGRVDLITDDVISNTADCFEGVTIVNDSYLVALDKSCIDTELSDLGAVSTERTTANEGTIPIEATRLKPAADWEHLVTLPRQNLSPYKFRMVDEWIDPIVSAYVEGKDFLFQIYHERQTRQKYFFLSQPGLPELPEFDDAGQRVSGGSPLHVWHFPDPDGWWFQFWGRATRNREKAGFTVTFDTTPFVKPELADEKEREYLFAPNFGTSLEGFGVGGPGAPEIKEDFVLKIYVR